MLLGLFASFSKPTLEQREEVAAQGLRRGHNYDEVTCTRADAAGAVRMPRGPLWAVDTKRVKVGNGRKAYQAGKQLLQRWGHFQLSWAEVSSTTRIKTGEPVCVVAKTLFLWMANPLKIVYASEEHVPKRALPGGGSSAPVKRFHFGQGCLRGHSLAGEEAFRLEWDKSDGSVWFEIYTVSRPGHPVSLLTYPLVRYYQSRFKEECAALVMSELKS